MFDGTVQRERFAEALRVSYRLNSREYSMSYHTHEGYELVMVHKGQGTMFIDNQVYEIAHGNVFLIDAKTVHRSNAKPGIDYDRTNLTFVPEYFRAVWGGETTDRLLEAFRVAFRKKEYCFQLPAADWSYLDGLLRQLSEERSDRLLAWPMQCFLLGQVLVYLNRYTSQTQRGSPAKSIETLSAKVIAILDADLRRPLSLDDVASRLYVSKHHLCRTFKKETGFTVGEYVRAKRILKARVMLEVGDEPVSEIAFRLGFKTASYFCQVFKRETGLLPSEFRRTKQALGESVSGVKSDSSGPLCALPGLDPH